MLPQKIVKKSPLDMDVKKIRDHFPDKDLVPGRVIDFIQIERILKLSRGDNRFNEVTNRWRHLAEIESNLHIGRRFASEFFVMSESEKLSKAMGKFRSGQNALNRSITIANRIDYRSLTADEKTRLDHTRERSSKMIALSNTAPEDNLPKLESK